MTDELLLQRAQRGDPGAFEQLITPYEGLVWRVCWQYMNHTQDAQDCAQETMLKAWRSIATFRADSKLETWLYRLAVNCCLDALRKKKVRPQVSADALHEEGFDPADPAPTPEESAEACEDRDRLHAALDQLPDDQRTALLLSAAEGLSYERIAEVTDTPIGTVKSRINRARRALAEIYQKREQNADECVQKGRRRAMK